jgi:dynein assembly factor 1
MTPDRLLLACKEHGGYTQPELNDCLYLHFVGYRKIENLEPYTALKGLWLESNGLTSLGGLSHLVELRCLYLHNNLLQEVSGLECLVNLQTLNLSSNSLTHLSGLSTLPSLRTLNLSKNAFSTPASIAHLTQCATINTLDLSDNELPGGEGEEEGKGDADTVLHILAHTPALTNLILKGNPVCRTTRHYRKTMLSTLARLVYLDDRPVFEGERAAVSAWVAGGAEGERACLASAEARARTAHKESVERFSSWSEGVKRRKEGELAALNAERAGRGEAPLTHLPIKPQVSYTTASSKYVTEAMVLKRVTEAAEEAYRKGGSGVLNLGGVMDAGGGGGKRYTAKGNQDAHGREVKR